MFLAITIFVVSHFKNTPSCLFKYFESFDVIVVKKKIFDQLLFIGYEKKYLRKFSFRKPRFKRLLAFVILVSSNLCLKKDKMIFAEGLDVQIERTRILIQHY